MKGFVSGYAFRRVERMFYAEEASAAVLRKLLRTTSSLSAPGSWPAEVRSRPYLPPNPAVCIDCRETSAVDAIPCMRNLKSSAFEAFSRAVS